MELKQIVPWGRSFSEYRDMFSLTEMDCQKKILGCSDGPASFNAELTRLGGNVISIDPVYQFSKKELKQRINEVYDEVISQVELNKSSFVWKGIPSVKELGRLRMEAMNNFLEDYEQGRSEGRYIQAALPRLDFNDARFDLALCSHYLFLYSKQVSFDDHLASVKELTRVAKEVRIYPLIDLDGLESSHLSGVISVMEDIGKHCLLESVKYEFQKGATYMLVIKDK
jgi:hypothetical protein